MKVANIDREILDKLLNDLTNFSEIFRKDVTYDNIKLQKSRVSPSLQDIHFSKNHRGRSK